MVTVTVILRKKQRELGKPSFFSPIYINPELKIQPKHLGKSERALQKQQLCDLRLQVFPFSRKSSICK
jgi:hypothetical protein